MQSTIDPDDVERLLDVLGVSGLPYRNFHKLSQAQPSRPMGTTSGRVDAAFPLLAAAIPEIAGAFVPHHGAIEQINSITATAQAVHVTDSAAAPLRRPEAPPKNVQVTQSQVPALISANRITAPGARSLQEPLQPVETQIRNVFDMLRGTSRRTPAEVDSVRGINSLFHRR
jgi:hypothetical protein